MNYSSKFKPKLKRFGRSHWNEWTARTLLLLVVGGSILGLKVYKTYASPVERLWRECQEGVREDGFLALNEDCYAEHMERLTNKLGVNESLLLLNKIGERIPAGECHLGAHFVGYAALKKYESPGRAFQEYKVENYCSAGFTHGVVEEFMRDKPGVSLKEIAKEVCDAPAGTPSASTGGQWQCTHGFGHVLMAFTDYNLPESIDVCDEFPDENRRYGCGYGVFMENTLASHFRKDVISPWVKPDDPLYPCLDEVVPERYQGPCFEWAPALITRYETKDAVEALSICTGLAEERQRWSCLMGMGREIGTTLNGTPEQIVSWCLSIPFQYHHHCFTQTFIYYVTTPDRIPRGLEVCQLVPDALRTGCAEWFGRQLWNVFGNSAEKRQWCNRLKAGREYCYRAAQIGSG